MGIQRAFPIRKADEIGPLQRTRPQLDGGADSHATSALAALGGPTALRPDALADLSSLLLRGARFQLRRSRHSLPHLTDTELDALATQAADDALGAVLARLDDFRGASRFSTWASKFAVHEARLRLCAARVENAPPPEARS